MGRLFTVEMDKDNLLKCRHCDVFFEAKANIASKKFHGRYGRAYLCENVVNVTFGAIEMRNLSSGIHLINYIHCTSCNELIGWKYEEAEEDDQKYKVGMFILERARILKYGW